MIRYQLQCDKAHGFESWFRDSAAYDTLAAAGEVACPVCGSAKVEKQLMAPSIGKGGEGAEQTDKAMALAGEQLKALRELRRQIESNADYVGPSFAEVARKIHYGEIDQRNIYGETSPDDAKALRDEGIDFATVPWVPAAEN
ncbi:DUF1178 family protein [Oceanibaculum pacificum]|uniref:Uncharacterized protein n=1 Tax=Oceanibaculum pacificum TaxID=580166 RepID=A0A154WGM5_9PROT|nr:DUF1178 family protein [Oceanibaculum pacificum]KZD12649.1 hypothetical protein AUP43_15705 [Oceanibaculum pacificum]